MTPQHPQSAYKVGGNRNYGYGKSLLWAGKNALLEKYAGGHFATVAAHVDHWRLFCQFAQSHGIKDTRQIHTDLIHAYAHQLAEQVTQGAMKVAYGQNLLTSVNVVLGYLRGDTALYVSPSRAVGARSTVRLQAPRYLNHEELRPIQQALLAKDEARLAAQLGLAREFMLRFKETCLLDTRTALQQAERTGRITVTEGTKGGRGKSHHPGVARQVPVTDAGFHALRIAAALQGEAPNLIPPDLRYDTWRDHCYRTARAVGMTGFHDLRAAGACERYQDITGCPAPIFNHGKITASPTLDRAAREQLIPMLGHTGSRSLSSYLGGQRG